MKYVVQAAKNPDGFLRSERGRLTVAAFGFALMFLCLCTILFGCGGGDKKGKRPTQIAATATRMPSLKPSKTPNLFLTAESRITVSPVALFPSPSPTAPPPTPSPVVSSLCPSAFDLKTGYYVYVSVPHSVRDGAGLERREIGQYEYGEPLRLLDGPVCKNGYIWWRAESKDRSMTGWTVEGKANEAWMIACLPPEQICRPILPTPVIVKTKPENVCVSDKLAKGGFAKVNETYLDVFAKPFGIDLVIKIPKDTVVKTLEGPKCLNGTVWWKIDIIQVSARGWVDEKKLTPCPGENACGIW